MRSSVVLKIRNPFLLDASTYISVAIMTLLGISGLDNLKSQLVALILCVFFTLLYRLMFRTGAYERNPSLYFGAQAGILFLLFLLKSDTSDAFNFMFYILTVHASVVLTVRAAATWTTIFFVITCIGVLMSRGAQGIYAVFFYLVAFVVCAILGHTIQQTELTSERNEKLLEELQTTQQKLQELAVVEERNRLARDLHDSVKQQVFAISMQLGAARTVLSESDKAYGPVTEAEHLSQQAGTELTSLINALRPPALEHRSLSDAIREHVNEWARQNNLETEVNLDNVIVDLNVEQALFRVLQEALSNVARHSNASQVTVELKAEKDAIVLIVEDNGVGFDAKRIAKGIGLDSMQERLVAVNGKVDVISEKDQGTRVVAKVRRM
jgi:signal transduction histidine kinase